mmetsp:Transcript_39434/g.89667  ORF Transcript_39434/g.89667 Transcript_39434/m.89667 type:complete len:218 (+) Transcript_39434:288-941(+)
MHVEQCLEGMEVIQLHGIVRARRSILVLQGGVRAELQEDLHHGDLVEDGRHYQRSHPLLILDVEGYPGLRTQLHVASIADTSSLMHLLGQLFMRLRIEGFKVRHPRPHHSKTVARPLNIIFKALPCLGVIDTVAPGQQGLLAHQDLFLCLYLPRCSPALFLHEGSHMQGLRGEGLGLVLLAYLIGLHIVAILIPTAEGGVGGGFLSISCVRYHAARA